MTEAVVSDGTGALRVNWFNQPWLANRYTTGTQVVLSGKIDQYMGRLTMTNPEMEPVEAEHLHTNRIVPVYSLTANLTQKNLRRLMYQTISYWAPRVSDYLPASVRNAVKLVDLPTALFNVHFPESHDMLDVARWRLAFDEIFLLQLGVLSQKRNWQSATAQVFETPAEWLNAQIECLPFPLTGAQQRVLQDIRSDLASGHPMDRLIQGDVGSGKTLVAALTIAMITRHGAQAAVMAPTSILAEQDRKSVV
jgi:ATP-dependent DNA helicase RecG